jgi:hypothetical protein
MKRIRSIAVPSVPNVPTRKFVGQFGNHEVSWPEVMGVRRLDQGQFFEPLKALNDTEKNW